MSAASASRAHRAQDRGDLRFDTAATFLHLAEAIHGDLGMAAKGDVTILISQSGETAELDPVIDHFRRVQILIIAITGNAGSMLAEAAEAPLVLPGRGWSRGAAWPTTSTTMTLALGDALAMTVMRQKGSRGTISDGFIPAARWVPGSSRSAD